jgi:hypothetical protein
MERLYVTLRFFFSLLSTVFLFFFETESHYVVQDDLELLDSSYPPVSTFHMFGLQVYATMTGQEFKLYPVSNGELLKVFRQGSNIFRFLCI